MEHLGQGWCLHCSRKRIALRHSSWRLEVVVVEVDGVVVRRNQEQSTSHRVGKGIVAGAVGPESHTHMGIGTCRRARLE